MVFKKFSAQKKSLEIQPNILLIILVIWKNTRFINLGYDDF